MSGQIKIYVNDMDTPRCQSAVVVAQLKRYLASDSSIEFISETSITPKWENVPVEQAAALTHLLQRITDTDAQKFIWVSANIFITGALEAPFANESAICGIPNIRLGLQNLLIVNPQAPSYTQLREQAATILAGDFNDAIDAMLPLSELPPSWRYAPWYDTRRGAIAHMQAYDTRPWLNATAPNTAEWMQELLALVHAGTISPDMLAADMRSNRIRASMLNAQGQIDTMPPSAELRQMDSIIPHASLRVSPARLHTMQTTRYAAPRLLSQPKRPREILANCWLKIEDIDRPETEMSKRWELLWDLLRGGPRHKIQAVRLIMGFIIKAPLRIYRYGFTPKSNKKKPNKMHNKLRSLTKTAYRPVKRITMHMKCKTKHCYHVGKYVVLNPARAGKKTYRTPFSMTWNPTLYLGWQLFLRDFHARYRRAAFAIFWILSPIIAIAGMSSLIAHTIGANIKDGTPYPVYAATGIILWGLAAETIIGTVHMCRRTRSVLKHVTVPPNAIIIANMFYVLMNFAIKVIPLALLYAYYGVTPSAQSWLAIPYAIGLLAFGTLVGAILTPFSMVYQDVHRGIGMAVGALLLITPVLYELPITALSHWLPTLNPFAWLLLPARDLILTGTTTASLPHISWLAPFVPVIILPFALSYYRSAIKIGIAHL